MLSDIVNYIQGNINQFLGLKNLSPELQAKILKRQDICKKCPVLKYYPEQERLRCANEDINLGNNKFGRGCGCPFPDMTYAPDKKCPLEKW